MHFPVRKLLFAGVSVLLIVVSFSGWLRQPAMDFLSRASEENLASLAVLTEIQIIATAVGSGKIPVLSGSMQGVANMLDKAHDYLVFSNMAVALQLILLHLSKSMVFKVLAIVALALTFVPFSARMATRALVLLLFLDPGLSLYVSGVHYASVKAQLNTGESLRKELTELHSEVSKHEPTAQDTATTAATNATPRKKGLFKRAEKAIAKDAKKVVEDVEKVGSAIARDVRLSLKAIKDGSKKVIMLCINLLVHVVALFIVLPMLYFVGLHYLIRGMLLYPSWANPTVNTVSPVPPGGASAKPPNDSDHA
ncbi:MAG: hypothetical protein AAGB22_03660 [Bacteroidota bacterium]